MMLDTARSEYIEDPNLSIPIRLACTESWSGNERTASLVELPGLDVYVYSVPFGPGNAGGDVHHLSVCPDCILSRIALADVSGHGQSVASFGEKLRNLMQLYLGSLSPKELMQDLNQAVREELDNVHYATMVAVGWHSRRGLLGIRNAGHPVPLSYRASRREWRWLEIGHESKRGQPSNVPLGLLADVTYGRLVFKPQPGDLVILYSDGVSEATDPDGRELGLHGLMKLASALDCSSANTFGTQLTSALRSFRGGGVPLDDETIIVIRRDELSAD
jgi:sigma-B regulation protein RsbU (phosphoserine phosphatase)